MSSKQRGDLLAGAPIIKAYSKEAESRDNYRDKYYYNHVEAAKRNDDYVMSRSRAMYAILTLTEYVCILACILLWSRNTMTIGALTTIRIWLGQVFEDIEALGDKYQTLLVEAASAERFLELINIPPAIRNLEDPVKLEELAGSIEFKHVSFSYKKKTGESGKKVLRDISFYVRPNERIAIVGKSGSGKSTLITLLQRGYDPDSGSIEIDGNNLRFIDLASYHENLAVVDQNFLTLERTIAENISLGARRQLSEEEILHFCSLVDLNVDNFENGIHTMIGELGSGVSGGERQRIAIARALASEAKILVFDEPTSSLDAMTEASIKRALDEASKTRTTITIAHRLSTIQDAHQILVIDEGKIIAAGTHDELCKTCSLYITFVREQLVRF